MVDALGNLVRFVLLPGQHHDSVGVEPLIEGIAFDALLGDKAFDNDWLRAELDRRGASAVIPPKADRARQISCDFDMYKWRHLVENFFCDLKLSTAEPKCAKWRRESVPVELREKGREALAS